MNKKTLFVVAIIFISILTSCNFNSKERVLNKLDKHLNDYTGYNTKLEMKITMDDKESTYKMRERNSLNNNYSLEILEPEESKGIIIEFDEKKIHMKHANIQQSITLNPIKKFDESLLIGKFFRKPQKLLSVENEELSNTDYYVFRHKIENSNKYSKEQIIYLNKKDFKPHMLNIIDTNGEIRVSIKYINFKFTKD